MRTVPAALAAETAPRKSKQQSLPHVVEFMISDPPRGAVEARPFEQASAADYSAHIAPSAAILYLHKLTMSAASAELASRTPILRSRPQRLVPARRAEEARHSSSPPPGKWRRTPRKPV